MRRQRVERGIYRQQNGKYGIYVLVGGKPVYKTVGPKLAEARRQRQLISAQAHRGQLAPPSRITFAELAETWITGFQAQVASGERAERTLENYRYHLDRHLLPTLGKHRLQNITTDDAAHLIAQLRSKGLAPKTISGALVPLGRILALALRRGHITDHPLRRLEASERPRIARRDQRVLTNDEIRRLLDACLPRYQPLLATAIYTGMRLSELLGLTWQDIDFHHGLIRVRHQLSRARADAPARRVPLKTRAAAREIPLVPQLASLLKRHKLASHHTKPDDYVYTTTLGTPMSGRNVQRRALRRATHHAQLDTKAGPTLRFHDLRHTYASHLIIELKLDIAQVSRILGHTRPSITLDTYTHLFDQAAHAADLRQRIARSDFASTLTRTAR
ncbi:MAG: site-specific integrase [Actinobacteria bacterium]|nr:site-specific integrase [Actinomycetota bacterium]